MKYYLIISCIICSISYLSASEKIKKDEWDEFYRLNNIEGCFVLYDLKADKYYIYNEKRANEGFLPASTFKIPNSLIALETGAVKDENEVIKWDGIDKGLEAWNHDQDMRNAIKVSCVWFYQEIARRIGDKRMQHYIDSIGYGNKNIGNKIDNFWLVGKLRITPMQQIEFLKRLYYNNLPFSQRSLDIVKDILIIEKTGDFILRAKTGRSSGDKSDNGWWIGYIEKGDNVYFFVNNVDINNKEDANARMEITKSILRSMQLYR